MLVVELDPGLQLGVELHHADSDAERQTGLSFVGRHHHLGALGPGQQLIQRQHGGVEAIRARRRSPEVWPQGGPAVVRLRKRPGH